MRLFVAVPLANPVLVPLRKFLGHLAQQEADVKWVRPEQLHFTLAFLGDVPASGLASLQGACERSAGQCGSFALKLGNMLGFFPDQGQPRVVWLGLRQGQELLHGLQRELTCGLESLGFDLEPRKFIPHLTLGRVKDLGEKDLRKSLQGVEYQGESNLTAACLQIIQSELGSDGSRHTVLQTYPLGF